MVDELDVEDEGLAAFDFITGSHDWYYRSRRRIRGKQVHLQVRVLRQPLHLGSGAYVYPA
jgi:hypothetical protein